MYNKSYFTSGNFINYLTRKFSALAEDLAEELSLTPNDVIVDFGCGYGGLIDALYQLDIKKIYGTDISQWAINYGKEKYPHLEGVLQYYNRNLLVISKDYVFMLDVLEHMPEAEGDIVLELARENTAGKIIARIPISKRENEMFVLDVSNNDKTHITCHCREWWLKMFAKHGWQFDKDLCLPTIYSSDGVLSGVWR